MDSSVDSRQRSRYWLPWAYLGDQLARHRRSLASHDCCLRLVGDDRDYEYYVDTSRLVPSCLEHSGRLGPLACQVEIFVTLSAIYRYLGRLSTVLGMVLIKLLQRRQVPGVVVLIVVLQCRYHCHLLSSSCRTRTHAKWPAST